MFPSVFPLKYWTPEKQKFTMLKCCEYECPGSQPDILLPCTENLVISRSSAIYASCPQCSPADPHSDRNTELKMKEEIKEWLYRAYCRCIPTRMWVQTEVPYQNFYKLDWPNGDQKNHNSNNNNSDCGMAVHTA